MAPHSSTVAQKIPWMEEPGRLQSMGSLRAGHDWATSLSLSAFMHWRRKWQPTPVFLPGESQGWRSLVGCSPWDRKESDTTEATWQQQHWETLNDKSTLIPVFMFFYDSQEKYLAFSPGRSHPLSIPLYTPWEELILLEGSISINSSTNTSEGLVWAYLRIV